LTVFNTGIHESNHFSKYQDSLNYQVVRVYRQPVEKVKTIKLFAVVEEVNHHHEWIKTSGNIMLMLPKDSSSLAINYGDYLLIKAPVEETKGPMNPGEFDYKKYLSYQSVYHQAYLQKGTWTILDKKGGYKIILLACIMQKKLLAIFKTYIHGTRELAVISALILGDTDGIDNDLLYAYAGSGAIHVLSVSGLHVGLIFIALNWLLSFMERQHWLKVLKSVIIVAFLLFYAVLTGLSPAVMRSAVMLSLIICGASFRKSHNILNTLSVSAFALLIYDPFMIMNVGFLLSYFAMAGIIIFHPMLYSQYEFKSWLGNHIWSASCAAITAELLTFPLAMLFFHQFPVYFLLSNVIVIFLATVIMFAGIGLLAFSYFTTFSIYLGKATAFTVYLLNLSVIKTTALPYSTWKGISITSWETILIYLSIILFCGYFIYGKRNYLMIGIFIMIIVFSNQLFQDYSSRHQRKIIIYDINHNTAIDLIDGHSTTFIADTNLLTDFSLMTFHISSNRGELKINNNEIKSYSINNSDEDIPAFNHHQHVSFYNKSILFFGKRILILNDPYQLEESPTLGKIDYLVLCDNIKVKIKDINSKYDYKLLVIDGSNSATRNKNWIQQCKDLNVPFYSIINSGAMIVDIPDIVKNRAY
jgi:competence protein ComEC